MFATHARRWWTLTVLCSSLILIIVGNTVLNVAIPTMQRDLQASQTELQWIVDIYALVFAGLLLTAGALGDRFGRKGALQLGLVLFGVASLYGTMAEEPWELIVARAVMGVGSAFVMPGTLSILTNVFPPHERAKAIGIWAGLAGVGGAAGPITGGWLVEAFDWSAVFWVNVIVVVIAVIGGILLVPTSKDPDEAPLDPVGAVLSIAGLSALLYAIIEAPNHGWLDPITIAGFVVAAALLVLFGAWELRSRAPMLDLRLFRNARFSAASGSITVQFFVMFGMFFILTQYLQFVRGYTPLEAGLRTLPAPLAMMIFAPQSPRIVGRIGPRRSICFGMLGTATAMVLLSVQGLDTAYWTLAVTLFLNGVAMGLIMPPATTSIMSTLPLGKAGVGSAVNDTTREIGGALGVAVLGSVLASKFDASGQIASGARDAFLDGMRPALIVGAAVMAAGALAVARAFPRHDEPPPSPGADYSDNARDTAEPSSSSRASTSAQRAGSGSTTSP